MDSPLPPSNPSAPLTLADTLNAVPEEVLWISNFTSKASIQTYRLATGQFLEFFKIKTPEQLRGISHAQIICFRNHLMEAGKSSRTINNRLSALSSLFNHLITHQVVKVNPVQAVKRMRVNSDRVEAKALSPLEVRALLNTPEIATVQGIRDRLILGILFFTGARVNEVTKLTIKDYYEEQGFKLLDFEIKGGKRNRLAINPELQVFIEEYLAKTGHREDKTAPLLLPVKSNPRLKAVRHISKRQLERIWDKYATRCGIEGTTPHSARATFITQALENNCPIEDVQKSVGHSLIKTTQMYDKRALKLRNSASFAVRY